MLDDHQPATAVADVQLLFCSQIDRDIDSLLVMDLVALGEFSWSSGRLVAGTPFTMGVVAPDRAPLGEITRRWADQCEVLEMTLIAASSSELVFLDGPDEQLLLELLEGHPTAGDS